MKIKYGHDFYGVVAHKIYGVPMVINSANFVYFCALDKLRSLGNPRLIDIFTGG
jgi:geranylgeranyl diphosphate synthase type 3